MKRVFVVIALMLMVAIATTNAYSADVIFVVDESGSMGGEHAWLGGMISDLEASLDAAGVSNNQYGLVGFGGISSHLAGHAHAVGGSDWGTAADFAAATGTLQVYGGTEDGWEAINYALNHYTFREGHATNIVLVTDEDRDSIASLTYAGVLAGLNAESAMLNTVVNANFAGSGYYPYTDGAIGIDGDGNSYLPDGSGGYTVGTDTTVSYAYGTTESNYIDLALATGGAAWNLNQLRAGGNLATSFTNAFVDIKTEEIVEQQNNPIPEPMTMLLFGPALLGLVGLKKKRA